MSDEKTEAGENYGLNATSDLVLLFAGVRIQTRS